MHISIILYFYLTMVVFVKVHDAVRMAQKQHEEDGIVESSDGEPLLIGTTMQYFSNFCNAVKIYILLYIYIAMWLYTTYVYIASMYITHHTSYIILYTVRRTGCAPSTDSR